ncbi:MAG TPA: hypothetical protein VFW62_06855, partial [bacterium]|nr:hypothetical protein [bacterium]
GEKDIFSQAGGTDANGISSEHRRYRDELKRLLGPMAPALLRDGCGSLDVAKIKVKGFAEFKEFLQRQAELNDGKSFQNPYRDLLEDENFEPLLKLLYQEIDPDFYTVISVTETEALFKEFQAQLIEIDAEVFVRNQYNSKEGRENIRHVLGDASAFTKDQRSEVLKSVAKAAEEEEVLWFGKGHGLRLTDHVSLFNYFNWGVGEEEIAHATDIAKGYLKAADEKEKERAIQEEQYSRNPEELRVALLREVLGRKISKLEIQEMAHLAKSGIKDSDPRKQVQGHLAELWLLAVDTRRFGRNIEEAYGINAYLIEKTESLIESSRKIQNDEELEDFNEKLQDFLNGPIAVLEKGQALRWLKHQTMGLGLKEQFEDYPAETRRPYEALVRFSDQWKYALECGEKIL